MKYKIELTDTEYNVLTGFMDMISSEIQAYYFQKTALEPIKTTNVEDADEYQIGYNKAINDYNAMYEWLHDCFTDFEKFLLEKGFYTDEKFLDGFVVGQLMYDLICDHDMAEVISEFQKWQKEKKQAEDEIRVGDEVIITGLKDPKTIGVITMLANNNYAVICLINGSEMARVTKNNIKPTGRHFEEISQLLDKLRGEE